jgi:hypothetical protein
VVATSAAAEAASTEMSDTTGVPGAVAAVASS